jgi:hypothetical protein
MGQEHNNQLRQMKGNQGSAAPKFSFDDDPTTTPTTMTTNHNEEATTRRDNKGKGGVDNDNEKARGDGGRRHC